MMKGAVFAQTAAAAEAARPSPPKETNQGTRYSQLGLDRNSSAVTKDRTGWDARIALFEIQMGRTGRQNHVQASYVCAFSTTDFRTTQPMTTHI